MDRFWAKVNKTETCWLWTGATNEKGYGKFAIGNRRWVFAHVWVYLKDVGDIPTGMVVRHHCDTKACVRPSHLGVGTVAQNNDEKMRRWYAGSPSELLADVTQMQSEGMTLQAIANHYGIHRNTLWRRMKEGALS